MDGTVECKYSAHIAHGNKEQTRTTATNHISCNGPSNGRTKALTKDFNDKVTGLSTPPTYTLRKNANTVKNRYGMPSLLNLSVNVFLYDAPLSMRVM